MDLTMRQKTVLHLANIALLTFGILLFAFAETATQAASAALRICETAVVPALFPFMVLSDLIVRRNLLAPLWPLLPMDKWFALPASSACAFLLGGLCGFPIGARTVCGLYRSGALTKEEAERTLAFSNNTGPAFAVTVAGAGLWGSRGFGWYLYAAQLLSAVLVGVMLRRGYGGGKRISPPKEITEPPIRSLLQAVTGAAGAVIPLVGYIVFFSVLSAMASALIPSAKLAAAVCGLLEFTAGVGKAAALGGNAGRFLTGFAIGFSGLSVFVQSYNFTSDVGLSLRKTFIAKGLQGVITGGLCLLYPLLSGLSCLQ